MVDTRKTLKKKESGIRITSVEIFVFIPKSGHLGFATVVFNNQFSLSDIALFVKPDGTIKIKYPVKTLANGSKITIFSPLNDKAKKLVELAVGKEYARLLMQKTEVL